MNERRAAIRLFLLHLTSRHRFAVLALFARDLFSMITLFMSDVRSGFVHTRRPRNQSQQRAQRKDPSQGTGIPLVRLRTAALAYGAFEPIVLLKLGRGAAELVQRSILFARHTTQLGLVPSRR
jgi:hypothetical protein